MKLKTVISLFVFQISVFCLGIYISNYISWHDLKIIATNAFSKKKISTFYGYTDISDPIIADAIINPALLRMQKIDQGGPLSYFHYAPFFSRYDHCVGVFSLIQKYGGNQLEQLTGMYHDISHTAFSHVADVLLNKDGISADHSYQDQIHIEFLKKSAVKDFCEKYNIDINTLDPDSGEYHMLENDAPDICADRLEYNLRTAVVYKLLTEKDVQEILSHLHYDTISFYNKKGELVSDRMWYFDDISAAKKFGLLPLHFMRTIWNAPFNLVLYQVFTELLRYSFEKKYIQKENFLYGSDQEILDILYKIDDNYIIYMIYLMHNINEVFEVIPSPENTPYDTILKGKFRGINPLVLTDKNSHAMRLTEVDYDFCYLYHIVQEECSRGNYIKYKKPYKSSDIL